MPRSCGRGWRSCAAARRGGRRPPARCWRSRAATPTTGPPTRRCRCPSRPCDARRLPRRPAGGPASTGRSRRSPPRRASRAAAPLPAARRSPGWRSSPSWGWAPASPTTWASARPSSCSRWRRTSGPAPRPPHPAAVPDVAGRHVAAGGRSGSPPSCGCCALTAPAARAAPTLHAAVADADLVVTTYATATRDADELAAIDLAAARARRGAGRQEQPGVGRASGAPVPRRAPGRAHRHPGGEPAGGALVGDGRAQPGPPGHRRPLPRALRRADRAARQRRGGVAAAHASPGPTCCAGSRPIPRSSTTCPRRSRSRSTTGSRREQATLYRTVVDDMMEKIEDATASQRRGNVLAAMAKLKQVCNHPAQLLHDGSRDRAALRQGRAPRGDPRRDPGRGRPGAVLHPVHRVRAPARAAPVGPLRHRGRVPARGHPEEAPRRDGGAVPGGRGAAGHAALAQGGRHRAHAHRGQPRGPPRPLVEPGRREPGHRPRVPHRAAAQRPGAQVPLPRHRRGAHRGDDRPEDARCRAWSSARARAGSPSCPPTASARCSCSTRRRRWTIHDGRR